MATHDTDFHAWALEQAQRLRAGEAIDAANIAEELETLARSQEQQLTNRLAVLLQYLLKCEYRCEAGVHQPESRTSSWDASIKEHRRRVGRILGSNPSLKATLSKCIEDAYLTAVTFASVETGILEEDFPAECQYTTDFIFGF